jgi:hypothetical protein
VTPLPPDLGSVTRNAKGTFDEGINHLFFDHLWISLKLFSTKWVGNPLVFSFQVLTFLRSLEKPYDMTKLMEVLKSSGKFEVVVRWFESSGELRTGSDKTLVLKTLRVVYEQREKEREEQKKFVSDPFLLFFQKNGFSLMIFLLISCQVERCWFI